MQGATTRLSSSCAALDAVNELGPRVVDAPPFLHLRRDLLDGMDHRGVVTSAELPGDRRIAEIGQLPEHVHADLAGGDEGAAAALAGQLVDTESEHLGRGVEDAARCDLAWLV